MNWKEYYKQHLMSEEDAVNHIQSGNRVVDGPRLRRAVPSAGRNEYNAKAYRDVEIVHMAMGKAEYRKPEYAENFRHNASLWAEPAGMPSPRSGATSPPASLRCPPVQLHHAGGRGHGHGDASR